jgi:GNAT superfamily N-acetyltransferase
MESNQELPDAFRFLELEHHRPAMYMLWTHTQEARGPAPLPPGYVMRPIPSEEIDRARPVVEIDGVLTDSQWNGFRDRIVPDGLFTIEHQPTSADVGTISALHNPAATRFYFPGGGELGYLVVARDHRRQGLGSALVRTAVQRLHEAGYRHIFVGVQGWRLPAVRCYFRAGFRPFLHAPELAPRWKAIFRTFDLDADEAGWPEQLQEP